MKHSILILAILFLISSCGGGSSCNNDPDGLITENATVYYNMHDTPHFIEKYCYLIKTESNKVFRPKAPHSLSNLNIKLYGSSKVKITYRLIADKLPKDLSISGCLHKDRIPTALIEVIRVEKIK